MALLLIWFNLSKYINCEGLNHLSIPKLSGEAVDVWECISNFILLFTGRVITYRRWD